MVLTVNRSVPLAGRTTLGVGGEAAQHATVSTEVELFEALAHARHHHFETFVLGGGSNVLVSDSGVDGLVIEYADKQMSVERRGDVVSVCAGAALPWDELAATAATEGWAGIECMSGIPGHAGAAPVQNIGAYGQQLDGALASVRVVDRDSNEIHVLPAHRCGLGYRWSHFKGSWRDRYVITQITLELRQGGAAPVRYGELRERLGLGEASPLPPLSSVREAVLAIRRDKSMLADPSDPNGRSVGSFFVNPVVSHDEASEAQRRARAAGLPQMPVHGADGGATKLSAAWLVEHAGFPRGYADGSVGVSTRHALALINRGGATAADVIRLAARIRKQVQERFAVTLQPEPVLVGFEQSAQALLGGS